NFLRFASKRCVPSRQGERGTDCRQDGCAGNGDHHHGTAWVQSDRMPGRRRSAALTGWRTARAAEARVVVVGAGFAGLEVARRLGRAGIPVVIVDRNNHHLFQPLLYQVATAALSATDVSEPVREILRRYQSVKVVYGTVVGIDATAHRVLLDDGRRFACSHLVLATGSEPHYFGHADWARHAPGL